jgi:predicted RNase H-like HicB family nuclease
MRIAVVKAALDREAGVWYVESSDVEGLHIEGETFEAFCINVSLAVADLLEGEAENMPIEVIAHASLRVAAVA